MSREVSRTIVIASQEPDYHYSVVFADNVLTVYLQDGHTIIQQIEIPIGDAAGVGRAILDILPR